MASNCPSRCLVNISSGLMAMMTVGFLAETSLLMYFVRSISSHVEAADVLISLLQRFEEFTRGMAGKFGGGGGGLWREICFRNWVLISAERVCDSKP